MPTSLDSTPGVVDTIHGVSVADPYRWLEDRASEATERWICDQKTRFDHYFEGLGSLQSLRDRVTELVDIESVDQVGKVKNRYFYRKRGVAQQQASIFVMESGDHCERLLVDSPLQDPFVAARIFAISADASLLAYEVKRGGEHTKAIHLVDVNTGSALSDHLKRGLARGLIFRGANDGFYHCHEFVDDPAAEQRDHTVCFHRLGSSPGDDLALLTLPRTPQSKLVLISERQPRSNPTIITLMAIWGLRFMVWKIGMKARWNTSRRFDCSLTGPTATSVLERHVGNCRTIPVPSLRSSMRSIFNRTIPTITFN